MSRAQPDGRPESRPIRKTCIGCWWPGVAEAADSEQYVSVVSAVFERFSIVAGEVVCDGIESLRGQDVREIGAMPSSGVMRFTVEMRARILAQLDPSSSVSCDASFEVVIAFSDYLPIVFVTPIGAGTFQSSSGAAEVVRRAIEWELRGQDQVVLRHQQPGPAPVSFVVEAAAGLAGWSESERELGLRRRRVEGRRHQTVTVEFAPEMFEDSAGARAALIDETAERLGLYFHLRRLSDERVSAAGTLDRRIGELSALDKRLGVRAWFARLFQVSPMVHRLQRETNELESRFDGDRKRADRQIQESMETTRFTAFEGLLAKVAQDDPNIGDFDRRRKDLEGIEKRWMRTLAWVVPGLGVMVALVGVAIAALFGIINVLKILGFLNGLG